VKFSFHPRWFLTVAKSTAHFLFSFLHMRIKYFFLFPCCSFFFQILFSSNNFIFKNNSVLLQVWGVVKWNKILKVPFHVPMLQVCVPLNLWYCPCGRAVLSLENIDTAHEKSKQDTTIQTFDNACVWVYVQLCILVSWVKAFLN